MKKGTKIVLIHGVINVLLPVLIVLFRRGVFGIVQEENPWEFFWLGVLLVVGPVISSLIGMVSGGIVAAKIREKGAVMGVALSAAGFVLQILFRFVLRW